MSNVPNEPTNGVKRIKNVKNLSLLPVNEEIGTRNRKSRLELVSKEVLSRTGKEII